MQYVWLLSRNVSWIAQIRDISAMKELPRAVGIDNYLSNVCNTSCFKKSLNLRTPLISPCHAQMSMFLNDVLDSYKTQGLVPRLSVSTVAARLCNVGVRLGGISKNT